MKPIHFSFSARSCRMQSVGEVIREIFNTSREAAQALLRITSIRTEQ